MQSGHAWRMRAAHHVMTASTRTGCTRSDAAMQLLSGKLVLRGKGRILLKRAASY